MQSLRMLVAAGAWAVLQPTLARAEPDTVFLVRHAEQDSSLGADPPLSAQGKARAALLADVMRKRGITAVFTTNLRRTQETAKAVAQDAQLSPTVFVVKRGELQQHVADVVAAVRQAAGHVLVVGHSNTVPMIASALAGTPVQALCESSYGLIFVITPRDKRLATLRYGEPDSAASADCQ